MLPSQDSEPSTPTPVPASPDSTAPSARRLSILRGAARIAEFRWPLHSPEPGRRSISMPGAAVSARRRPFRTSGTFPANSRTGRPAPGRVRGNGHACVVSRAESPPATLTGPARLCWALPTTPKPASPAGGRGCLAVCVTTRHSRLEQKAAFRRKFPARRPRLVFAARWDLEDSGRRALWCDRAAAGSCARVRLLARIV